MTKINDYIRGDTRILAIPCTQSDGITPLTLTGGTIYVTINTSNDPTDDTGALQKIATSFVVPTGAAGTYTVGNSTVTVTNGQDTSTLGLAWITILPTDTSGMAAGVYNYDIQFKDSSGNISSIKQDKFTINADITRSTA